ANWHACWGGAWRNWRSVWRHQHEYSNHAAHRFCRVDRAGLPANRLARLAAAAATHAGRGGIGDCAAAARTATAVLAHAAARADRRGHDFTLLLLPWRGG